MRAFPSRLVLCFVALAMVLPPSYAKRLGSGRSIGRQSSISRQAPAPYRAPVAPQPVQPSVYPGSQPGLARSQPYAPPQYAPQQVAPQRSSGALAGAVGGTLLGLGLGSMMSRSHNGNNGNNKQLPAPAGNAAQTNDSGNQAPNGSPLAAQNPAAAESHSSPTTGIAVLGLIALGIWLYRRRRSA
ncbi:MAG: hypothetical protein ACRYGK_04095 [Janthinobacterium lividum]